MAIITINVLWQVFSRFVLQDPSSFTEELARYMLIWIGILGASYVAGQKLHLAIDLLSTKLTGKSKSILEIFIQLCIFVFSLFVMVIGGIRLVSITLQLKPDICCITDTSWVCLSCSSHQWIIDDVLFNLFCYRRAKQYQTFEEFVRYF